MKKIKGFIFDIDGTLIDSNDAHAECLKFGLSQAGYKFEFDFIRRLIGMGLDQILPKIINHSVDSDVGKAISQVKDECFAQKFEGLPVFPGATEVFKHLHQKGFKITLATSASKTDLEKFIQKLNIGDYIEKPVSSDDVEKSKPAADPVAEALKKIKLNEDEVYMVGDTIYDIQSAKKAGVRTIAFRSGGGKDSELPGAAMILDGPGALLEWLIQQDFRAREQA